MPHGKYNTYNKCVKNVKSTDCFQNQNDYPKMKSTNEGLLSASVQGAADLAISEMSVPLSVRQSAKRVNYDKMKDHSSQFSARSLLVSRSALLNMLPVFRQP